ncbi:competence type IV pilus minor pilin ComGF [Oceanobacillus chungangensis]|uniref:Competence protein ComGF n=1 Tax=Oceanobacillus chungangensis TaxID=1229152 RepID=A0A3D8Q2P3_9BACI|nr:ComGF family competence protein [Oceanobacillus chungangensis]RDW21931.1 hypothetical protein CWR45_00115 [Oceanobacillus chungangensis]
MLEKEKRPSAYLEYMLHERGFTFVSMLFAITILFITLPFTGYLLNGTTNTSNYEQISVYQFFQFLRDEVIRSTDISITDGKLQLLQKINNKPAITTIEKYDSLIRRQVDGTGHEIFLFDVKELTFIHDPIGFLIRVTTLQGNAYEKRIVFYE